MENCIPLTKKQHINYHTNKNKLNNMEEQIKALEEFKEVMKAGREMLKHFDKTINTTISTLKLINEQYDK